MKHSEVVSRSTYLEHTANENNPLVEEQVLRELHGLEHLLVVDLVVLEAFRVDGLDLVLRILAQAQEK